MGQIINFFSDWKNTLILAAIAFFICCVIKLIITIYKKKIGTKVIAYLDEVNYTDKMKSYLSSLFANNDYHQCKSVSRQIVSNFEKEKKLDYLVKYYGFIINDETTDILKRVKELEDSVLQYLLNNKFGKYAKEFYLYNYVPIFEMSYVSPAGRSSANSYFALSGEQIDWLIGKVSEIQGRVSTTVLERNKLTTAIRESVLARDNFTCLICGNSVYKEPNLLLEVDHIIPISKGGKTEPNNLQTLCWKCNRKKSDNI